MSFTRLGIFAATALFHWALPVGALQVSGPAQQYKGTVVPAVRDSTLQWAQARIGQVGLKVQVERVVTTTAKPGTVLKQSPAPNTHVPLGSEVHLVVAVAPPTQSVTMPYLIGFTRDHALRKLDSLGLTGRDTFVLAPSKVGLVVRQVPDSGTPLKNGVQVRFWYGQAGKTLTPPVGVQVPDVRHVTVGEARAKVQAIGLKIAPDDPKGIGDVGLVARQHPLPNELVPLGTSVRVEVVAPPIIVPNVVGWPQQQAEDTMRHAGLRPRAERYESHRPPGTVLSQSLSPGSAAAPNSEVVLSVARPPVQPPDSGPVPNVLGKQVDSAIATLTRAPLRVISVDTMAREGAVGLVDAQHPSAGTRVAFGDSATITVAVPLKPVPPKPDSVTPKSNDVAGLPDSVTAKTPGERPKPKRDTVVSPTVKKSGGIARVRVPPLVGLSRTNAIASLGRSRLLPGVITWATDSGATAKVVRQDPPADTMVRQGAPVDMTLAVPPPPPVVVPLVIGLAPDSAESLLALAALRAERRDTSVGFEPGGLVERQDPRARDTVPRGSVVQVLVGRRAIPWMLIVSCVLGVGGVGAFAWKLARDRGRIQEREAPLPVLGLDPKVGDGKHEMGSDQQRATGHELQLAAGTGAATQRVDGDETFIRERP